VDNNYKLVAFELHLIYDILYNTNVCSATSTIVSTCPITVVPYKYLELQVSNITLKFNYKPSYKNHNFFHSVFSIVTR
jgi:hypothetical protein